MSLEAKSDDVSIPKRLDVVIVGAGLGGLTCAVELARQGLRVGVFERHRVWGGYAHSFRRKGYHFDVSLHHIGGFSPGCLSHGFLESLGIFEKLKFKRPKELFTAEFPDFKVTLPNHKEGIIAYLTDLFPNEANGIRDLFDFLPRLKNDVIGPTIDPLFNTPFHDRLSNHYLDKTYLDLLKEFVLDEKLLAILGQMWAYIGLPPSRSAANFSSCVNASAFVEGTYSIVGGGAALGRDIVERLRELGGDCFPRCEVSRIQVENGVAKGIELADGTVVEANIVVSAANPLHTFGDLVPSDQVSDIYKYRLRQMEPSLSMYTLYLGLDCEAKDLGIPGGNFFYNHHSDFETAYQQVLDHNIYETDYCLSNSTSSDISVAPPGSSIISFVEMTPPGDWFELDEDAYNKKKEEVSHILLNKYDKRFNGLSSHIEVLELGTPKTMARFTNNYQGAVYGFAQTVEQSNSKRLRNRTPIKGLFLTGAWTWSGGGYEGSMVTGLQTAQTILSEYESRIDVPPIVLHPEKSVEVDDDMVDENKMPRSAVVVDENVSLDSHYKYIFPVIVYGDDLNSRGNADASSYLRYMDRARMEAVEEICRKQGKESWLVEYIVNVYRIEARCATVIRLADQLEVRTGIRRISTHRASFDQRIVNNTTGNIVADAAVEVLFLNQASALVPVPEGLVNTDDSAPDFSLDRTEPLPFTDEDHFPFRTNFRVYFEDTDCQAIMFHVSYVRYCERALFDLVRTIWPDVSTNTWMAKSKVNVSRVDIRFLKAAKLGDYLEVRTGLVGLTSHKLSFGQRIVDRKTGAILADAVTDCDFRDETGKALPMPKQIADIAKANLFTSRSKG